MSMQILGACLKKLTILGLAALIFGAVLPSSLHASEQVRSINPDNAKQISFPSPYPEVVPILVSPDTNPLELTARSDTVLARRWAMTRARLEAEKNWLNSCQRGACRDIRANIWHKVVSLVRESPSQARPARVQQLISRGIRYVRDAARDDHWATPLSTLLRKAGDCEDHVLLKRAVLEAAGSEPTASRLLILKTARGEGHMVLQILGDRPVILDNRFRYPIDARRLGQDRVAAVVTDDGYFVADEHVNQNTSGL
ncbi:transglutaminase-like cysteine peptidase [Roseibium sp. SCPC15]|uniref:transglutaminase-like cysteine peptidase n=1 Tax=Roseibium sp. SCP15 TaxID=3141376 RepID=UPI003335D5CB